MKSNKNKSKKKNFKINDTYLIIVIVVLSICIVSLSGYIVYDKWLREYFLDKNCKGCNIDTVAHINLNPVEEMEDRLGITIPVLKDELDEYVVGNDYFYARISFNKNSFIEIADKKENLFFEHNNNYSESSTELINDVDLSIYWNSGTDNSKVAIWYYNDVYYAFKVEDVSLVDFDKCVEDLIKQVIGE